MIEEKSIKTSPIFYMGNKKRLIKKGLVQLFPKNINTFYELFGGSAVVSLNTVAKKYCLNELDTNIYNLYKTLRDYKPLEIVEHIKKRISEYNLPNKSTNKINTSDEEREYYKANYMKFRSQYNKDKNPLDLFVLMNYALSQTMRFNSKGEFNMPFGNNRFIEEKHKDYYIDFYNMINSKDFNITNKRYEEFFIEAFNENDFIYLDPPYINTTATYNENSKWTETDNSKLLNYCDLLTKNNIKWAMSNVFENKGIKNDQLINWVECSNYNVYDFDNFTYHACGKGVANTNEVLITNYILN